jgi:hypothetical protein
MTELKPCNEREKNGTFKRKHGMYGTRLYHIWNNMMGRCRNVNNKDYEDYGGRGIMVCPDWEESSTFFEWAKASGYSDELTIERVDVNGDYCPENCRWATNNEQQINRRNNKELTYNGETHCVAEWGRITGIPHQTITSRLRYGWTIEETLTTKQTHRNNLHRNRRVTDEVQKETRSD